MTFAFALFVAFFAAVSGVLVAVELVEGRRELARRRAEFERWERLLGPTMERWKEGLRAEGHEVPPGVRRRG